MVFRSALMKFQGWPWGKLGHGWVLYSARLSKFSSLHHIKMFWAMGKKNSGEMILFCTPSYKSEPPLAKVWGPHSLNNLSRAGCGDAPGKMPPLPVFQVVNPQFPRRGLLHLGHPREWMHQGRYAHPGWGAPLNPGWVQEGDGVDRRRGTEPEKHHSALHFITMATSWKPYRI